MLNHIIPAITEGRSLRASILALALLLQTVAGLAHEEESDQVDELLVYGRAEQ